VVNFLLKQEEREKEEKNTESNKLAAKFLIFNKF
jgi:hypothetical protein